MSCLALVSHILSISRGKNALQPAAPIHPALRGYCSVLNIVDCTLYTVHICTHLFAMQCSVQRTVNSRQCSVDHLFTGPRFHHSCLSATMHFPASALNCTELLCTTLHCTALHYTALHCTALYCTATAAEMLLNDSLAWLTAL